MCSPVKSHSLARAGLNPTNATSQAPGQLFSEVEAHALHLARERVAYDVVRRAKLERNPKLAGGRESLLYCRVGRLRYAGTTGKDQSKHRSHQPMERLHGVPLELSLRGPVSRVVLCQTAPGGSACGLCTLRLCAGFV